MGRTDIKMDMSREAVSLEDISSRLAHKKVCNVTVKRNQTTLNKGLDVIGELVKSGRLKAEGEIEVIRTPERLQEFMEHAKRNGSYVIDVETTGLDVYNDILVGICLYTPDEPSVYVPFNHTDLQNVRVEEQMTEDECKAVMIPFLADPAIQVINHNIKFDDKVITFQWGQRIANVHWDTLIGGQVLNENEKHGLKPLYNKYILNGEGSDEDFGDLFEDIPCNYLPIDIFSIYGANDGFKTWAVYQFQKEYLREDHARADFRKLYYVFREVEMPLIDVCMDMELRGVEIREEYAKDLSIKFNAEMQEKEVLCDEYVTQFEEYIKEHSTLMRLTKGTCKINYNSPQQVSALLYDIFKLKSVSRKEPRGTGEKIIQQHRSKAKKAGTKKGEKFAEFLDNYQRYKECGKLLGTYIDKIPAVKCEKTGAVHTTFNQYGAVTGRFSSSDSITKINLQNIPSHEKSIRKIFRAREGYKLVGGDFSQIEPRVLAYFSGDEAMIEAYKEGKDLYAIMGSKVYGVPYEECLEFYPDGTINSEGKHRRTTMKSVLLGIMYERGAKAIGEQFDKSADWAQKLIDDFYKSFPKVQRFRLKVEKMAEEYGYVTTICGRKRRLPDMQLSDHDDYRYQEAHRQSLNSVVQGSSADIMKLSMIEIYRDPLYKELNCHMIITVHDELIMEVPEENIKEGAELLVSTMKRVGQGLIDLPMSVDAEVVDYWYGENLAEQFGMRVFMKAYKLVNFCEFDPYAVKSYCAIHKVTDEINLGDITLVDENSLEPFTMICGGSPCQDFSVAGKLKGAKWVCLDCGEEYNPLYVHYTKRDKCPNCNSCDLDKSRSSLLVEWLRVIRGSNPNWGIYENVKNIVGKQFKETFNLFLAELKEYGYNTYWSVLNAKDYGIPQNRERVYLFLVKKELDNGKFKFPKGFDNGLRLKDFLDEQVSERYYLKKVVNVSYKANYAQYDNSGKGYNSQDARGYYTDGFIGTVSYRNNGDKTQVLLDKEVVGKNIEAKIRKLMPKECWRLMGFNDEDYSKAERAGVPHTYLYRQAGNSIVVDVLYHIYKSVYSAIPCLFDNLRVGSYFSGIGAFEKGLDRLYEDINNGNFI